MAGYTIKGTFFTTFWLAQGKPIATIIYPPSQANAGIKEALGLIGMGDGTRQSYPYFEGVITVKTPPDSRAPAPKKGIFYVKCPSNHIPLTTACRIVVRNSEFKIQAIPAINILSTGEILYKITVDM